MLRRITGFSAGLLLAIAAHAETETGKPVASAPVTVLKAAHLFDGRSGKLSEPGVVVVKGERIVAIGKDASIPADARIELSQPDEGVRQTIFSVRLTEPITIANLTIPAGSEIELDDDQEIQGATLGAAIPEGPIAGLSYDRGAYVPFIDGRWALSVDDAMSR